MCGMSVEWCGICVEYSAWRLHTHSTFRVEWVWNECGMSAEWLQKRLQKTTLDGWGIGVDSTWIPHKFRGFCAERGAKCKVLNFFNYFCRVSWRAFLVLIFCSVTSVNGEAFVGSCSSSSVFTLLVDTCDEDGPDVSCERGWSSRGCAVCSQ